MMKQTTDYSQTLYFDDEELSGINVVDYMMATSTSVQRRDDLVVANKEDIDEFLDLPYATLWKQPKALCSSRL